MTIATTNKPNSISTAKLTKRLILVTPEVHRIANSARATMLCIPVTMKVIMTIAHTIVTRLPRDITRIMSISHSILGDLGFSIC